MNDYLVSNIRTLVPKVVAGALTWLGLKLGVDIDSAEAVIVSVTLVEAVYYGVVRKLEEKVPAVGILLGVRKPPTY